MDMDERREREDEFKRLLQVERGPGGEYRYVTFNGIALGRLKEADNGVGFRLEWRAGWHPYSSQFEGSQVEHAEGWAVEGIASMMAIDEQAWRLHG